MLGALSMSHKTKQHVGLDCGLWLYMCAYWKLPWSRSTQLYREWDVFTASIWGGVKPSIPGTWFKLASSYFQALVSHHNAGKPEPEQNGPLKKFTWFLPGTCIMGKAIGFVCCRHKNCQIWRSRHHSEMYHYGVINVGKPTFFCLLDTWEGPRAL